MPPRPIIAADLHQVTGGNGGTAGNDTLQAGGAGSHVFGFEGNDLLQGSAGRDFLFGDAWGPDRERDGDDTLIGGRGDDLLAGSGGSDLYLHDVGADGHDEIADIGPADGGTDTLVLRVGNAELTLQDLLHRFEGSGPPPTLVTPQDGSPAYLDVTGFSGVLQLDGSSVRLQGVERVLIEVADLDDGSFRGAGIIAAAGGADATLTGTAGKDTLVGGEGSNLMLGGAGNDVLSAATWDPDGDTMVGGSGDDTMNGGRGADVFVHELGADGHDRVYDLGDPVGRADDTLLLKGPEGMTLADLLQHIRLDNPLQGMPKIVVPEDGSAPYIDVRNLQGTLSYGSSSVEFLDIERIVLQGPSGS
jgi:Ca2+-binding RTX toxin-like protein